MRLSNDLASKRAVVNLRKNHRFAPSGTNAGSGGAGGASILTTEDASNLTTEDASDLTTEG